MFEGIDKLNLSEIICNHIQGLKDIYIHIQNQVVKLKNKQSNYIKNVDIDKELVFLIRNISMEIYSACEIINELFISIYRDDIRYRGSNLQNSYNANFKKIYSSHIKNSKLEGVYSDCYIDRFYYKSEEWFVILHDIRTQETHYKVGNIEIQADKLVYLNQNRNGISKYLYTNANKVLNITIEGIIDTVHKFIETSEYIEHILVNIRGGQR